MNVKLIFALLAILVGAAHGFHVIHIAEGAVENINGLRFLSFAQLDRFASSGEFGKLVALSFDAAIIFFGLNGFRRAIKRRKR
jgi:hypothetical protein